MSKPVTMLTAREVRALRDSLLDKKLKGSTVNRFMTAFKACLTLAAEDDERITNRRAWKLPALRDTANPRNVILTERQVRDLVVASYATGGDRFAGYVEILAATGARPIQARRLTVADLEAPNRNGPRLNMPSSKKGRGKKRVERVPLPIPAGLAKRLKALAVGRADHELLLIDDNGTAWRENGHQRPFAVAAAAAGSAEGRDGVQLEAHLHHQLLAERDSGAPRRRERRFVGDTDRGDLFEVHNASWRRPHARCTHRLRPARAPGRQRRPAAGQGELE
jgi:hypothetical protein